MARAHAANAFVQSDSIKGLAQSIAKPAYHRLLVAEPALRRAVPTLIIAFLITICLGAFVQVIDQSRQKRAAMKRDLSALTDLLAERLDRFAADGAIHDIHNVRVRDTDAGEIVNFHCRAAPSMSVIKVHENVDEIERALRRAFPSIKRVISHAEPPRA